MRLGQRHVFIVPCLLRDPTLHNSLGFSGHFLAHMLKLSSEIPSPDGEISGIRDALIALFDLKKDIQRWVQFVKKEPIDELLYQAYAAHVRQVFSLGAGGDPELPLDLRGYDANQDKMSIVLNGVGNGLKLRRNSTPHLNRWATRSECHRQLLLLALAASDPTVLCTLGKPLKLGSDHDGGSWLCEPSFEDLGMGILRQEVLPPLTTSRFFIDPSPLTRWIGTEVFLLGEPESPSTSRRKVAEEIIAKCKSLEMGLAPSRDFSSWGPGPQYQYWRIHTDLPSGQTDSFALTLTCVLQCGLRWILGVATKCGFPDTQGLRADAANFFSDGFMCQELQSLKWAETAAGQKAVNAILRVANWLNTWGALMLSPGTIRMPGFYNHSAGHKIMIYSVIDAVTIAALPTALVADGYASLSRVWILQAEGDLMMQNYAGGPEMFLRTKSPLFSNLSASEFPNGSWKRGDAKVWGPSHASHECYPSH